MNLSHNSFADNDELCPASGRDDQYCAAGDDAWLQTLWLLERLCTGPSVEEGRRRRESARAHPGSVDCKIDKTARRTHATDVKTVPASITVIERHSPTSVVLRWCSRCCHYGDQLWSRQMARSAGICAVTGKYIKRGDPVFRPKNRGRTTPANTDAMIHASAFD